jgi:hypothetical protein
MPDRFLVVAEKQSLLALIVINRWTWWAFSGRSDILIMQPDIPLFSLPPKVGMN